MSNSNVIDLTAYIERKRVQDSGYTKAGFIALADEFIDHVRNNKSVLTKRIIKIDDKSYWYKNQFWYCYPSYQVAC